MKKTLLIPFFVLSTVLLALTGCVNTQPATSAMEHSEFPEPQYMKARVLEIKDLIPEDPDQVAYFDMQIITVKVTGGKFDGQVITVEHIIDESSPYNIHIQPKDEVLLAAEIEGEQLVEAYIESHARDRQLKTLSVVSGI
ncbi:MAG TPA: hypothetical protein GX524_02995 [Firmicutes bacterium]|nr:hypothetical protein [Bacillota bacterium]